jgi:ABC-type transport system involved in cytochrome c biogenesis permease subunit
MERGYFLSGDPKIVWSLAVWGFYLALMVGHRWFAQGGRRFAWAAVGSFAFVMLTFWSFNLLSGIHQN